MDASPKITRMFSSKRFRLSLATLFLSFLAAGQTPNRTWGEWTNWGAQQNGTFINPILPSDYSDIDCIGVGDQYIAISSTFQYSPGMVVLRSYDLVNWSVIGHVVQDIGKISPSLNWDRMDRYGRGIWAGAIRFYKDTFRVYFGTPDEGYFVSTATDPAGPWEPVHQVMNSGGWDDCCPFWDDDGQGYLVGTDFSHGSEIHLFNLSPDGKDIIAGTDRIIHQSEGSEANKLYKINGWYYHLFSEVKQEGRVLMMERARSVQGPYDEVRQLHHGEKAFMEPNQGGLIQTKQGGWYFITHHGTGDWAGREVSLLPVTWVDDWPVIGEPGPDVIGRMVWSDTIPVKNHPITNPATSDDFSDTKLSPQWEWNYQPRNDKWSLAERPGWLRLYACVPLVGGDLTTAPNTLTQRVFRTEHDTVTVKLDVAGMKNGQRCGLSHFGYPDYATVNIICEATGKRLAWGRQQKLHKGASLTSDDVWLRSIWSNTGTSRFYYSLDGQTFQQLGPAYPLKWQSYRGDRIVLFTFNDLQQAGFVDIDYLHYTIK